MSWLGKRVRVLGVDFEGVVVSIAAGGGERTSLKVVRRAGGRRLPADLSVTVLRAAAYLPGDADGDLLAGGQLPPAENFLQALYVYEDGVEDAPESQRTSEAENVTSNSGNAVLDQMQDTRAIDVCRGCDGSGSLDAYGRGAKTDFRGNPIDIEELARAHEKASLRLVELGNYGRQAAEKTAKLEAVRAVVARMTDRVDDPDLAGTVTRFVVEAWRDELLTALGEAEAREPVITVREPAPGEPASGFGKPFVASAPPQKRPLTVDETEEARHLSNVTSYTLVETAATVERCRDVRGVSAQQVLTRARHFAETLDSAFDGLVDLEARATEIMEDRNPEPPHPAETVTVGPAATAVGADLDAIGRGISEPRARVGPALDGFEADASYRKRLEAAGALFSDEETGIIREMVMAGHVSLPEASELVLRVRVTVISVGKLVEYCRERGVSPLAALRDALTLPEWAIPPEVLSNPPTKTGAPR